MLNIFSKKIKSVVFLFSVFVFWGSGFYSYAATNGSGGAGGIALGATRVIYPLNAKQVSLSIINYSTKDKYLINSWIDNEQEQKTKDFIVTPPLFVIPKDNESTLRIVNASNGLPEDRESLYWLNVKAIPSIDKDSISNKNVLQIAVLSRIKIFVRPEKLEIKPEDAYLKLTIKKDTSGIVINNPTPYFMNIANLKINGNKIDNVMVYPFSSSPVSYEKANKVSYQLINDYGGFTPEVSVNLN